MRVKRRPRGVGFRCVSFAPQKENDERLRKDLTERQPDGRGRAAGAVRLRFSPPRVSCPKGQVKKEFEGGRGEMRRKTTPSRDSGKASENRSERLNPSDDFGKDDPVYGFKPSDYLLNMIFSLSNIFASSTASSAATTRLTAIVISTATGEARKEKMPFIARALLYSGMRYQR